MSAWKFEMHSIKNTPYSILKFSMYMYMHQSLYLFNTLFHLLWKYVWVKPLEKKKKNIQVEELFSGWLLTKNFSLLDINLCLKFYLSTDIIHSEFSEYFFCFIKFNILTIYWNYLENQQSNDEVTFKKLWSTYHNSNSFSVTNKI